MSLQGLPNTCKTGCRDPRQADHHIQIRTLFIEHLRLQYRIADRFGLAFMYLLFLTQPYFSLVYSPHLARRTEILQPVHLEYFAESLRFAESRASSDFLIQLLPIVSSLLLHRTSLFLLTENDAFHIDIDCIHSKARRISDAFLDCFLQL